MAAAAADAGNSGAFFHKTLLCKNVESILLEANSHFPLSRSRIKGKERERGDILESPDGKDLQDFV